jgi:Domain of unknown function (DUF4177)
MAFTYKVVEMREKMFTGRMSGEVIEQVLNDHAAQGWQVKAITAADVKGKIGPSGVGGLLITFEKQI